MPSSAAYRALAHQNRLVEKAIHRDAEKILSEEYGRSVVRADTGIPYERRAESEGFVHDQTTILGTVRSERSTEVNDTDHFQARVDAEPRKQYGSGIPQVPHGLHLHDEEVG